MRSYVQTRRRPTRGSDDVRMSPAPHVQGPLGRTLEDLGQPGLTGEGGEERHLDAVDQAGGHQRPVHRHAACERNGTPDSCLSRATASTASPLTTVAPGQPSGPFSVVDTTVAGRLLIRVTHGSPTSDSPVPEASVCANARWVLAPRTIRCCAPYSPGGVLGSLLDAPQRPSPDHDRGRRQHAGDRQADDCDRAAGARCGIA